MKNYAKLIALDPESRRYKLIAMRTFDDSFERQASKAIGELLAMSKEHPRSPKVVVYDKTNLRKDLARYVEQVQR